MMTKNRKIFYIILTVAIAGLLIVAVLWQYNKNHQPVGVTKSLLRAATDKKSTRIKALTTNDFSKSSSNSIALENFFDKKSAKKISISVASQDIKGNQAAVLGIVTKDSQQYLLGVKLIKSHGDWQANFIALIPHK